MIELIVIVFLLVFISAREHMSNKERQKLVDKIISKDLNEYTACQVDMETAKKKPQKDDINRMMRI